VTDDPIDRLAARYLRFAEDEARGRSALYDEFARRIADDQDVLAKLSGLIGAKRQPNLLFGAVKFLFGAPNGWDKFRELVLNRFDEILAVIMRESTQTNEPARCGTLLPVLARFPQPLALIEIGAAGGLCLIPDRYAYDYGGHRVAPMRESAIEPPTFSCAANPATPLPNAPLEIAWRAGLDLKPIDINDDQRIAWLEALVWPDEGDRTAQLRKAVAIARLDPPRIFQGDLRTDLLALVAQAPRDATLVVFHSAVIGYLNQADRAAFVETMRTIDAIWISNEAPEVFSHLAASAGLKPPWPQWSFLLTINERPIAWTDSHGASIDWIQGA
jgi:hypothetical protein